MSKTQEDDPRESQITNATNFKRDNITVDAVKETWKRELSGEQEENDIIDHVWRYVLQ